MSHELEPIRQLADALRNAPVSWLATTDRIADLSTMERDGFLFDQEFMESFLFSLVKRFGADEVANGLEFFADKEEFY